MLTTFDLDDYVIEALRAGASGFLLKTAPLPELVAAIEAVAGLRDRVQAVIYAYENGVITHAPPG